MDRVVLEFSDPTKVEQPSRIPISPGTVIPENLSSSLDTIRKRTAIFIQDECLKHRFIRSRDSSGIFECPERLHAVKLGLAAAIARIEHVESATSVQKHKDLSANDVSTDEGDLTAALARMTIAPARPVPSSPLRTGSVVIRRTSTSVSLLNHPAIKYVHGDIERDVYLENLVTWARDSQKNIMEKGTEIPEGVPPLDLYRQCFCAIPTLGVHISSQIMGFARTVCPGSIDAIQGAIGAVCEAVDASVTATRGLGLPSGGMDGPCERAFVAIRPPGHHCGEDTPSGFCFINNVAVGAAHAHLKHGIQRIVILDIDLHHGNGTQSIVWQINEETYRQTLEPELLGIPGPRIFYGSLHDILSFPCEDGKPELIQAASTSIHGPHGQYIENVHLEGYDSEVQFWGVLYPRYLALLHRARNFLDDTGGPGDDVIMFISCGFDAGEHEYPSMSRYGRKVPVGFYHRFTREACKLADIYANGRIVSVLEGGYSDRALISGAMAHLCGFVDVPGQTPPTDLDDWVDHEWWSKSNLTKLEKVAKPRKATSARASMEEWLARAIGLLPMLNGDDTSIKGSSSGDTSVGADANTLVPSTSMTLRERKKPVLDGVRASGGPPDLVRGAARSVSTSGKPSSGRTGTRKTSTYRTPSTAVDEVEPQDPSSVAKKKLPRVILHVRPQDDQAS